MNLSERYRPHSLEEVAGNKKAILEETMNQLRKELPP